MARNSRHLAAIALIAAAVAVPAWADVAVTADQDQPGTSSTTENKNDTRVLDVLVVTGATLDGDTNRWADDADASVPEIADTDWVPAQDAPAN